MLDERKPICAKLPLIPFTLVFLKYFDTSKLIYIAFIVALDKANSIKLCFLLIIY